MIGMEDKIIEARKLAGKFAPVVMKGAIPEREDFYKLSVLVREVLLWIREHDDPENIGAK